MPLPLRQRTLWADPNSLMAREAVRCATSLPSYAAVARRLAAYPVATWFGDWTPDPERAVADLLDAAGQQCAVIVLYNVPGRDGGSYSAGGAPGEVAYCEWVDAVARGIYPTSTPLVIIEPDALAMLGELSTARQAERYRCLKYAVRELVATGALVYVDAGDATWIPAQVMADRLYAADADRGEGSALNVSHFDNSALTHAYAQQLRALLGTAHHYVIDTSRNGRGSNGASGEAGWCCPVGAGIGARPTTKVNQKLYPGCDARLWVKGFSSDGPCNGAPPAGEPYPEYTESLYRLAVPRFKD